MYNFLAAIKEAAHLELYQAPWIELFMFAIQLSQVLEVRVQELLVYYVKLLHSVLH
jgi:hypothetical protein